MINAPVLHVNGDHPEGKMTKLILILSGSWLTGDRRLFFYTRCRQGHGYCLQV